MDLQRLLIPSCQTDRYEVYSGQIKHTIPCFGYVIKEKGKPGGLNVPFLKKIGIEPGPMYSFIKNSADQPTLTLNGKVYPTQSLFQGMDAPRKVVILGDTNDPYNLCEIASGADVLVHECTLPENLAREAPTRGHSTAKMAAYFGNAISAKTLILNHFSPRWDESEIEDQRRIARRMFVGNDVLTAHDFTKYEILKKDDRMAYAHQLNKCGVDIKRKPNDETDIV